MGRLGGILTPTQHVAAIQRDAIGRKVEEEQEGVSEGDGKESGVDCQEGEIERWL